MAILKCKICGGDLSVTDGRTYATCEYCGSIVTLPKTSDQRIQNLFNRANHLRMNGEFDRAIAIYELILNEDDASAEAHWGMLISRLGIEYVEDSVSHKRIPTCHRIQNESILADDDYRLALEYAHDPYTRGLYESEGKRLFALQRDMLEVSGKSDPYDIFICYKESADDGSRTRDSEIAQGVFDQLISAGYRVFFARITLEDKLGQAYEPYVFSALNSSKVMLVIGTKTENFNAVWVRNEWSRFLAMSRKDHTKLLIPCYRDMSPYDLPDELSILQSQDMSKIGFMQDLLRGIKKIIPQEKDLDANPSNTSVANLLDIGWADLADGLFDGANEHFEEALDIDPKCSNAHLGLLCAQLRIRDKKRLEYVEDDFSTNTHFMRALRYANESQKAEYAAYDKNAQKMRKERIAAKKTLEQERIEREREKAQLYEKIETLSDGDVLTFGHYEQGDGIRGIEWRVLSCNDDWAILIAEHGLDVRPFNDSKRSVTWEGSEIREWLNGTFFNTAFSADEQKYIKPMRIPSSNRPDKDIEEDSIDSVFLLSKEAIEGYLPDKDSRKCAPTLYAINQNAECYKGSRKKYQRDGVGCCYWWLRSPKSAHIDYKGNIHRRISIDSQVICVRPAIRLGLNLIRSDLRASQMDDVYSKNESIQTPQKPHEYLEPPSEPKKKATRGLRGLLKLIIWLIVLIFLITAIPYCIEMVNAIKSYDSAVSLMNSGQYKEAARQFSINRSFRDSELLAQKCYYANAEALYANGDTMNAAASFANAGSYQDAKSRAGELYYNQAETLLEKGDYDGASEAFYYARDYRDAAERITEPYYVQGDSLMKHNDFDKAAIAFDKAVGYLDAKQRADESRYNAAMRLYDVGDYDGAYAKFIEIKEYNGVATLLAEDKGILAARKNSFTKIGAYVDYGSYEQNNDTNDGQEAIQWLILSYDKRNNRSLLISQYALEAHYYHGNTPYPTWKDSAIRIWLNNYFFNTAFTHDEQDGILESPISTPAYKDYSGGGNTKDRIFLLSREEAEQYFSNENGRKCSPTLYAEEQGVYTSYYDCCDWWLRSPGSSQNSASVVEDDGELGYENVTSDSYAAVRPAFWLDLKSIGF